MVGHTKAAAGIGGFIKAVLGVNRRILPPTANCSEPNPILDTVAKSLYPILQEDIRHPTETNRAGITGAGFNGINCHVTIESHSIAPRLNLYHLFRKENCLFPGKIRNSWSLPLLPAGILPSKSTKTNN